MLIRCRLFGHKDIMYISERHLIASNWSHYVWIFECKRCRRRKQYPNALYLGG